MQQLKERCYNSISQIDNCLVANKFRVNFELKFELIKKHTNSAIQS